MTILKEVLALRCSSKLPVYQTKRNAVFLIVDFSEHNIQVCRFNFYKHRDRFLVVVWDTDLPFKIVSERIRTQTTLVDFESEDEIVLDGINIFPLSKLKTVDQLEENKKYIQVSTRENKSIKGLDLIETFTVT